MPNNIPTSVHFLVCSRSSPHFRAQLFVCREDCLQVLDGPFALPSRCRSINTFEVGGWRRGTEGGGVEKDKSPHPHIRAHTHTHTEKEVPVDLHEDESLSQPLRHPSVPPPSPSSPPLTLLSHTHTHYIHHHHSCFLLHNYTTVVSARLRAAASKRGGQFFT